MLKQNVNIIIIIIITHYRSIAQYIHVYVERTHKPTLTYSSEATNVLNNKAWLSGNVKIKSWQAIAFFKA